ncbi:hypothetical protein TNCV_1027001, partial [Trichonephila clavipes]
MLICKCERNWNWETYNCSYRTTPMWSSGLGFLAFTQAAR